MSNNVIAYKGCETWWFADNTQGWNKNKIKKTQFLFSDLTLVTLHSRVALSHLI